MYNQNYYKLFQFSLNISSDKPKYRDPLTEEKKCLETIE